MSATEFNLITDWRLVAPRQAVWDALMRPEDWPSWWRAVLKVEQLSDGDAHGVGALRRLTWRTALPYTLTFDMGTTRVEPMSLIEGRAVGELDGIGRWSLSGGDTETQVRYQWTVAVTQPWMRVLAPLLRPVFAWNHGVVMGWGYDRLTRKLTGTC